MSDRAISEVLGFVLVFALVTMTIGVVYTSGFSGLYHAQQSEQLENMERAFDVLDDNFEDIHHRGAPNRATEIKLADGELAFEDPVDVTIYAEDASDPSDNVTFAMVTEPIVFRYGDTGIIYDQDAVIRRQSGGSAMLSAPGWVVDADRAVIPFLETHRKGQYESMQGGQTILVVATSKSRGSVDSFDPPGDTTINVTIGSEHTGAWRQYLASEGFTITREQPDLVSAEITTDSLYVPQTEISVEFRY